MTGCADLIALPLLLLSAYRLAVEMFSHRAWAPAARRYTLAPALTLTAFVTSLSSLGRWRFPASCDWITRPCWT